MKNKILTEYPHLSNNLSEHTTDLYVVDYTEMTKNKKEVEIHSTNPNDIDSFLN